MDSNGVADVCAQHRAGNFTAERPHELFETVGDGHQLFFHDEFHLDQVPAVRSAARDERHSFSFAACRWARVAEGVEGGVGVGFDRWCRVGGDVVVAAGCGGL